jgi:SNF2 family DNA or RNA helicase
MGGMQKEVDNIVNTFRDDPTKKIFIGSIMAAGTGLNLQFCNTMCFVELPWTWAVVDQAMSRIHRIGQKNACSYYFLMAEHTIDQMMYDLILSKKEMMESTTNYAKIKKLMESI